MKSRLEDEPRTVTLTLEVSVRVGYETCSACGAWTPPPTTQDLVKAAERFVQAQADMVALDRLGGYLWPDAGDASDGRWNPPGWTAGPAGLLCEGCSDAVQTALDLRRRTAKETPSREGEG